MSSLKKRRHQVKERWTLTCIKQVILKSSKTVVLCYLEVNEFYVVFFQWNKSYISVKIIIMNDFCDLEQVLSLI